MRGRPGLVTAYQRDMAIFPTNTQRVWFAAFALVMALLTFVLSDDLALRGASAAAAAVGAIGLNLVTGWAGQISLGHAFFLGIGAYTAAALGGETGGPLIGLGLEMWIWLPAAGLVAAVAGIVVAPIATRLRGLYLAFVTLGLVFIGEHIFREWDSLTGGIGVGRSAPKPILFGYDLSREGSFLGFTLSAEQQYLLFALVVLLVMGFLAKNLVRGRVGRAFSAIRDRDVAAEIMGINLARHKLIAFAISSFYAGIAGALLWTFVGFIEPRSFSLTLSIVYIAMILIGGAASIMGSIMGAVFITFLPRIVDLLSGYVPFIEDSPTGGFLTVSQVEQILFGLLIVVFLIVEPLGLYGIWIRIRNYWKAWPFSY
ncbi:MAG: branched-chain amino acid ABC transporter permease [Acidimicrobiia bacterium]|nr:branched-chain amino acid ABC transporter permease [Acidimicrobiia bacterium]